MSLLKIDARCHIGGTVIFLIFFYTMMYYSLFQAVYLSKFTQSYSVVDTLLELVTQENRCTLSHLMLYWNILNEGKSS